MVRQKDNQEGFPAHQRFLRYVRSSPVRNLIQLCLPKRRFSGFRARCGLKSIHDFLRLPSCPRTAYQNRRSAPKTKRSGTQPIESGWRSGGAVSFSPTPTGMRNGADGPPLLGELLAATRLAMAPVSPSASRIGSERRLALAALGPALPHIVPTRSDQTQ